MIPMIPTSHLRTFWKMKYQFLTSKEIASLRKTKDNATFDEWYEALQSYADALGEDWDRSLVTDCGPECWQDSFEKGMDVETAFKDGFSE